MHLPHPLQLFFPLRERETGREREKYREIKERDRSYCVICAQNNNNNNNDYFTVISPEWKIRKMKKGVYQKYIKGESTQTHYLNETVQRKGHCFCVWKRENVLPPLKDIISEGVTTFPKNDEMETLPKASPRPCLSLTDN